ncbi:hypothetical protein NB706_003065 [Xanthomonas sacchari]|nr:hypothetical protein [Xanthomonas sacchari]
MATCAITRTRPRRPACRLQPPRPPPASSVTRLRRRPRTMPSAAANSAVAPPASSANSTLAPLRCGASPRIHISGTQPRSRRSPSQASTRPARLPSAPISRPSANAGRLKRSHAAPSAARTALSWLRPSARSSIRLVRLIAAISSTQAAAAKNSHRVLPLLAAYRLSCSGSALGGRRCSDAHHDASMCGLLRNRAWSVVAVCADAAATLTPGRNRATTISLVDRLVAARSGCMLRIRSNGSAQGNSAGSTPTICTGLPSTCRVRPTADGSPSK